MKKVMKNPYLLLSLLLLLLISVYLFMVKHNEWQAEEESAVQEAETIYVTNHDELSAFSYSDGNTTMTFVKSEDEWQYQDAISVSLDQSSLEGLAAVLAQIKASREMTGDLEAADSYGLAEPVYKITLTDETGTVQELLLGNSLADGSYYAKLASDETVYVIDSDLVSSLVFDLNTVIAVPEVPTLNDETVTSIEQTTGADTKKLTAASDEESTLDSSVVTQSDASDSQEAATPFADGVSVLSSFYFYGSANYQPSSDDLADHGLTESARTTYKVTYTLDEKEQEFVFYVGALQEDSGYYYAQVPEDDVVYQVSSSAISSLTSAFSE